MDKPAAPPPPPPSQPTTDVNQPLNTVVTISQQKGDPKIVTSVPAAPPPPPGNAWTNYGTKKAEAVLTQEELGRIRDLGLGRGVDATDPTPWVNKRAFQVRAVTFDAVLGTEEGGALQSYEQEVTSVHTQQSNLRSSILVPQSPVRIGVDEEYSRSASVTRQAIGKRVITRSVAFTTAFDDFLSFDKNQRTGASDTPPTTEPRKCFEQWLCYWLLERQRQNGNMSSQEGRGDEPSVASKLQTGTSVQDLDLYLQSCSEEQMRTLNDDCKLFVNSFRITHYVSEIQLGAAEYRVLSQSEYYSKIGISGTFGVDKLANLVLSQSDSWKKTKKASDIKRIGIMSDEGVVTRGSYGEAVVGVKMEPITALIRLPQLRGMLQQALMHYVDKQGDTSSGPFVVSCKEDRLFWTVDKDAGYAVKATSVRERASPFFLFPHDDGSHPYEFIIGYYGDSDHRPNGSMRARGAQSTPAQPPELIPRFLQASVNHFGYNSGPLCLKYNVNVADSRLTLHSRLINSYSPVDPVSWAHGQEIFYVCCVQRRGKKNGYICVKESTNHGNVEWITACKSSMKRHDDEHIFMLFRLLPYSQPEVLGGKRNAAGIRPSSLVPQETSKDEVAGKPLHSGEMALFRADHSAANHPGLDSISTSKM